MPPKRATLLCRYQYDPLNRLTTCTLSASPGVQRFYLKSRLVTEVEDQQQRSIFQYQDQLLGQLLGYNGAVVATLLATDQQRSVLNALGARRQSSSFAYAPYGHRSLERGLPSLPGFNGEKPDPVTGHYLLGNGYRAFNPVLMRFNSPDNLSPFGKGGINAYVYCSGDPVNREDGTGHIWTFLKRPLRALGIIRKSKAPSVSTPESSIYQAGNPDQDLEQAGSPVERITPTPRPSVASVREVPNQRSQLKIDATKSGIFSHTITVVDAKGKFVANLSINNRQNLLIKLAISTFDSPTIMDKSEVIRKQIGHSPRPPGWSYQRYEDL